MLLAVDIGNTDIALGIFENGRLNKSWHVATDIRQMVDEYAILLLNLLHNQDWDRSNIEGVVLCSVVPPLTVNFVEMFQRYFGISPLVVGAGVKTGVRIRMDNPREVGADRIVNAVAAHYLYQIPVIIVDLGTATTFDAVSGEGDYLGGVIAPGISTAAESLFMRAAMLPRVELVHPSLLCPRAPGSCALEGPGGAVGFEPVPFWCTAARVTAKGRFSVGIPSLLTYFS